MEIGSNQKKLAIVMMLACIVSGAIGLITKHWIVNEEMELHASLTTTYWTDPDYSVGMVDEEAYSEGIEIWCSMDENMDWADDLCDDLTALRNSGIAAIAILIAGIITGLLFIVVVYRSSNGVWDGVTAAPLDYRFGLGPAVSITLAPVVWWGLSQEARSNFGDDLSWSFYLTLLGGLTGVASCVVMRNTGHEPPIQTEGIGVDLNGPFEGQAEPGPNQIYVEKSSLIVSEKPNQTASIIALLAIVVSLFLPYASLGDGLDATGADIIEGWGELVQVLSELDLADFEDDPGAGSGGGDSGPGLPLRGYLLMVGAFMFMLSPLVFLLSGISGAALARAGTVPRILGFIHLGFFLAMMLMIGIGGTLLSEISGENPISFMGVGLWIGGLSSIGFIYRVEG